MKTLLLRSLLAAAFVTLILAPGCASSGPTTPEKRSGNPAADLAGMLSGRFEGATPGNKLILNIQSVVIRSLEHPYDPGQPVFEAYAQNRTPGAYRVFWCYGPAAGDITIIAITPHP